MRRNLGRTPRPDTPPPATSHRPTAIRLQRPHFFNENTQAGFFINTCLRISHAFCPIPASGMHILRPRRNKKSAPGQFPATDFLYFTNYQRTLPLQHAHIQPEPDKRIAWIVLIAMPVSVPSAEQLKRPRTDAGRLRIARNVVRTRTGSGCCPSVPAQSGFRPRAAAR